MIIPRDRLDEETRILARLSQGDRIDHFDTIRVRKDGATLDISPSISPVSPERLAEIQSRGVGVGITGMRERVRQSHGELTIDSDLLGAKITAIFPAKTPAMREQGTISRHGVA